jgi:hypothetical protein
MRGKNLIRHLDGPSVKTMSKRKTTYGIIFAIDPFLRRRPKSFLYRLYPLAWVSLPHSFSLLLATTTVDIRKLHFSRVTDEPKKEKLQECITGLPWSLYTLAMKYTECRNLTSSDTIAINLWCLTRWYGLLAKANVAFELHIFLTDKFGIVKKIPSSPKNVVGGRLCNNLINTAACTASYYTLVAKCFWLTKNPSALETHFESCHIFETSVN